MGPIEKRLEKYLNNESRAGAFSGYSTVPLKAAVQALDYPQRAFKSILITGTNGKGTVAFYLYRLLKQAGFRCGLYTSPHLVRVNERIVVDTSIPDEEALAIIDDIAGQTADIPLTWFDMMTLTAFEHFKRASVEYAVLETGLGGSLDSTTLVDPVLSVITDISLDHTQVLGATVAEIARDKSAVIRKNVPCVSSSEDPAAVSVIRSRAKDMMSTLYEYGDAYSISNIEESDDISFTYTGNGRTIEGCRISGGSFASAKNAAGALTSFFLLQPSASDNDCTSVLSENVLHGRFERLGRDVPVYYDVAHNESSLKHLIQTVDRRFSGKPVRYFVSFMIDKQPERLLSIITATGHETIYCLLPDSRAYTPDAESVHAVPIDDTASITALIDGNIPSIFCGTFRLYPYMADIIKNREGTEGDE